MRKVPLKNIGVDGLELNRMVHEGLLTAQEAQERINEDFPLSYSTMLKMLIRLKRKGKSGYTPTEVRTVTRLCALVDESVDYVLLSDKDYEFIRDKLDECENFAVAHKNIVEFLDDFENAENLKSVKVVER